MNLRNATIVLSAGALVLVGGLARYSSTNETSGSAARVRLARPRVCATRDLTERETDLVEQVADRLLKRRGLNGDRLAQVQGNLGTIRVAVHVIYRMQGPNEIGRLSQVRIQDQIDALNAAYENLTFILDSVDYTENQSWFNMSPGSIAESQAKSSLQADPTRFLNLYTVGDGGGEELLGWATFPWELAGRPELDGVVINHESFPGGVAPYDEGDTAVHEVGHWLGLYHTFQGSCTIFNDRVMDTAAERSANFGCPGARNSCPQSGADPIHNFMDYSDDLCLFEFTSGQYNRITRMLAAYRAELLD